MKLKKLGETFFTEYGIDSNIKYDFIITEFTYSGVLMSSQKHIEEREDTFISNAINRLNMLSYDTKTPYQIIKNYQEEYPTILKTRRCISILENNNLSKYIGLIWFDDGDKDPRETLIEHLKDINWDLGKEFEY